MSPDPRAALNEVRTRDVEIIGDALQEALGVRQLASIADYLGGGDEEDDRDTAWMEPDIDEGGYFDADDGEDVDFTDDRMKPREVTARLN